MTQYENNKKSVIFIAMDIAKVKHDVLIEWPNGKRKKMILPNNKTGYDHFISFLGSLEHPCVAGFEATGNYHRTIAHYLLSSKLDIDLKLISSVASARTREAMYNSWDKNDPKDAQVILHLLKTGLTQIYHDPLVNKYNDIQELSKTYQQVSLRKVKVQHSIMTHYLPLYFPEVEKYFHSSRAKWFSSLLLRFPAPSSIVKYSLEEFTKEAWNISGRKVNKEGWLRDFYETAKNSIGIPVSESDQAITMFKVILKDHIDLCEARKKIEEMADNHLRGNADYQRLRTIPGIGPIIALVILAESGDLRRFKHYRQFLKFCGFDLSTHQSGNFRGQSKISKHGNSRLRQAFWMAATIALRMRENTFRKKFENYVKEDPKNADLKRKGYTATAAKMARVAYGLIKSNTDYLCYHKSEMPSGKISSLEP